MAHSFDFAKIKSIPLTDSHALTQFDCGNEDLNDFLLSDAKIYLRHLRYTTTLLKLEERIIAYYSLANDLLTIRDKEDFQYKMEQDIDTNIEMIYRERFFNQAMYPAAKIGRLAVDSAFQCRGIGSFIIQSLIYSFKYKNKTGCQFITVDALNNTRALHFYEKHKFKLLTLNDLNRDSRAMYKPLI